MSTTITNAFQKTLNESISETNKIWIDKDNELYNTSMKSLLQNNYIKMYQHIMKENLLLLKDLLEP